MWKLYRATQKKAGIIIVILKALKILEKVTNTKDQSKNRNKNGNLIGEI